MYPVEIKAYDKVYRQQILELWERSVLATHDFLSPGDFKEIKALVQDLDFGFFDVYCLVEEDTVLGFIGVAEQKIEMLFLAHEHLGKGLGKRLLGFALDELDAQLVDVNEQNEQALRFYQKAGFEIFDRSEQDEQGKSYPLLRMKLKEIL